MPSRLAVIAIFVACFASAPLATASQQGFLQALEGLEQDAQRLDVSSAEIFMRANALAGVEAPHVTDQPSTLILPDSQKRLSRSPVDILLRRISVPASQGFVEASLQAQPDRRAAAIVIESGTFNLEEVAQILRTRGFGDYLEKAPNGYVAHRPIFIWTGGALKVGPGERLSFDASQGAFVINTGALEIEGARLDAVGVNRSGFRPFLLTTFAGATRINRTEIVGLGFSGLAEASGIAFTHQQFLSAATNSLTDNVFEDGVGVTVSGARGFEISGNRFVDGPQIVMMIKAAREVRIAGNIVSQRSGLHAIKVSNGSSKVDISHNIIVGSPGNGVFVDGGVTAIRVSDNLIGRSRLTGISVDGAACVAIENNAVIANRSRGIAMRSVLHAKVQGNDLIANVSAGLTISGQFEHSSVRVARNNFVNNRFGLSGSIVGEVNLVANDFTQQLPRIADGEFAANVGGLLEFAASQQPGEFRIKTNRSSGSDDFSQFSAVDLSNCVAKKGS